MTSVPSPVFPAATVLLLRESPDAGLQVLMTKRAAGLSFMGGLWVFPGGRMEVADQSPEVVGRVPADAMSTIGSRLQSIEGHPLGPLTALAHYVAACRETFEEAGVLLATPATPGVELDASSIARLAARRATSSDTGGFVQLLVDEDLVLDVGRLVYWSHWVTPSFEKKRFDTRFFAVQVPPGQEASADLGELTQHAWLTQEDIQENLRAGEMKLAPPTIATLQDLWSSHAKHGGVAAMLAAEQSRPVPPILPKLRVSEGSRTVLLPWDPEYSVAPGEGCVVAASYPDYLTRLPSRREFKL